jgi:hypothetical protein
MGTVDGKRAQGGRLRLVFGETVMWLGLPARATFDDVARTLRKLPKRRYGEPKDIRVTFERRPRRKRLH